MATKGQCPECGAKIILKPVGDSLLAYGTDGILHKCPRPFELKPIGQAIRGKTILDFHLKHRLASLVLSDNMLLEISASSGDDLIAMNLRLISPDGIKEEKK